MQRVIIIMFFLCAIGCMAQRKAKVQGEYIYYAQEGQTLGQVKMLAQQLAQAEAIANEFGMGVESRALLVKNSKDEHFTQFSDTEVNGVWLKDLDAPQYETIPWKDGFAVKCTVHGLVREITTSATDYRARVLCNGFDHNHERTDFKEGDDLFLSFTSPTDGFLAVYLMDAENTALCMLPYYNQHDGIYRIEANREYRLFSETEAKGTKDAAYVEEYTMTANGDIETNLLYVIFSPNKFYKAADHQGEGNQLRSLTYEEFNKWLGSCYSKDKDLTVSKYIISIEK